jgi:hypothetical protein
LLDVRRRLVRMSSLEHRPQNNLDVSANWTIKGGHQATEFFQFCRLYSLHRRVRCFSLFFCRSLDPRPQAYTCVSRRSGNVVFIRRVSCESRNVRTHHSASAVAFHATLYELTLEPHTHTIFVLTGCRNGRTHAWPFDIRRIGAEPSGIVISGFDSVRGLLGYWICTDQESVQGENKVVRSLVEEVAEVIDSSGVDEMTCESAP